MNDTKLIESQAWPWSVKLAGSILVLSIALKVIGIDFAPVMQALTTSIAQSIEHKDYNHLEERIIELEKLSHKPTTKKEDDAKQ